MTMNSPEPSTAQASLPGSVNHGGRGRTRSCRHSCVPRFFPGMQMEICSLPTGMATSRL